MSELLQGQDPLSRPPGGVPGTKGTKGTKIKGELYKIWHVLFWYFMILYDVWWIFNDFYGHFTTYQKPNRDAHIVMVRSAGFLSQAGQRCWQAVKPWQARHINHWLSFWDSDIPKAGQMAAKEQWNYTVRTFVNSFFYASIWANTLLLFKVAMQNHHS